MTRYRRHFMRSLSLVALALAAPAFGQATGRPSSRTPAGGAMTRPSPPDDPARGANRLVADPGVAIDRELLSLRADLALTPDQVPPFEAFAREVRNAAEAERTRMRHVAAMRRPEDGAAPPSASTILGALAEDDARRADATRKAFERLDALVPVLSTEQRRLLDQRILESVRDPLGSS